MKKCPVCGASCFDDMEICYGCLHHFEEIDDGTKRPSDEMSEALNSSKTLRFSFGESGAQSDGFAGAKRTGDGRSVASSNGSVPQNAISALEAGPVDFARETCKQEVSQPGSSLLPERRTQKDIARVPSPTDEPFDAVVLQDGELRQDEWVMRVAVPAGCSGVTVRLERA